MSLGNIVENIIFLNHGNYDVLDCRVVSFVFFRMTKSQNSTDFSAVYAQAIFFTKSPCIFDEKSDAFASGKFFIKANSLGDINYTMLAMFYCRADLLCGSHVLYLWSKALFSRRFFYLLLESFRIPQGNF